MAQKSGSVFELKTYTKIPEPKQREIWSPRKIEHLRSLGLTGRADYLWDNNSDSLRVYDRLCFENIDPIKSNEEFQNNKENLELLDDYSSSVKLAYDRIDLNSPLYLGDMSFGALSGIPNIALARAADITGVLTGTGEGGLNSDVAKCKRITVQWASGRFGVDVDVLRKGLGIVIKVGQGAKPGIGGHLPGSKVTESISLARRIPIGKDAISPAPHHDIYSIEDLGQRIWALKEATGKPVFVKVGLTNYIPYIASGVASMGADGIIIDGAGAGTGAAPYVVRDNIGLPIDLAVSSVDRILTDQGLRKGFSVIAAGAVTNAEDTAKLMALGADLVSIGTATLVGLGCLMVHKCHIGFCPALLTNKMTENPKRILSLDQSVKWTTNLILGWQEEFKWILRSLGIKRAADLVGRRELLRGYNMNEETAEILGVQLDSNKSNPYVGQRPNIKTSSDDEFWTAETKNQLWELSGVNGKSPGESVVTSMATTAPPFVDLPKNVCDFLKIDGAQVTRPSIDPYREPIETSCYLGNGKIRLSLPIFFGRISESDSIRDMFLKVAFSMGILFDLNNSNNVSTEFNRSIALTHNDIHNSKTKLNPNVIIVNYEGKIDELNPIVDKTSTDDNLVFIRVPSSESSISLVKSLDFEKINGILVDSEYLVDSKDLDIAITISEIDRYLRSVAYNNEPLRNKINLLASSKRNRGAYDVFKLIGLGADAVGLSESALISIGYDSVKKFNTEKAHEKLEYFVLGLQKELRLLAGAAGFNSISSTLTGNRELLRSVDLDPSIRTRLNVKPGGAP